MGSVVWAGGAIRLEPQPSALLVAAWNTWVEDNRDNYVLIPGWRGPGHEEMDLVFDEMQSEGTFLRPTDNEYHRNIEHTVAWAVAYLENLGYTLRGTISVECAEDGGSYSEVRVLPNPMQQFPGHEGDPKHSVREHWGQIVYDMLGEDRNRSLPLWDRIEPGAGRLTG